VFAVMYGGYKHVILENDGLSGVVQLEESSPLLDVSEHMVL
jgi:hypothetical protein